MLSPCTRLEAPSPIINSTLGFPFFPISRYAISILLANTVSNGCCLIYSFEKSALIHGEDNKAIKTIIKCLTKKPLSNNCYQVQDQTQR